MTELEILLVFALLRKAKDFFKYRVYHPASNSLLLTICWD